MSAEQTGRSGRMRWVHETVSRVGAAVEPPVGVVSGALAAIAGYVVFFGVVLATGAVDLSRSLADVLRPVGTFYYNAHNVPTFQRQVLPIEEEGEVVGELVREFWTNRITGWQRAHQEARSGGEILEQATQTSVIATDTSLPAEVYLAIPVVVLLVTGALVARRVRGDTLEGRDRWLGALAIGSAVTLGYLLVALLGTFVLARTGTTEGTVFRPARLEALAYGLVYPLVFATVGAALVVARARPVAEDVSPE